MTTTLTTMSRSNEGNRNRKTKALNAMLSATALGLFLEGCGALSESSSSSIGYSYSNGVITCRVGGSTVPCNDSRILAHYAEVVVAGGQSLARMLGVPESNDSDFQQDLRDAGLAASAVASALPLDQGGGQEGAELSALSSESVDELLEGSGDIDTLDGGEGIDTVSYANSEEGVEVDLSAGKGEKGDAEGDILLNIANLVGSSQDDTLTGDTQDNTIEGTRGNDILKGGAGADTYVFNEGDGKDTVVEVAEEGVVNTLRFEGDYEASDFSFGRSSEDATDLVITADTNGDGEVENEVTLEGYFTSETSTETAYSIVVQINDGEAFAPSLEA